MEESYTVKHPGDLQIKPLIRTGILDKLLEIYSYVFSIENELERTTHCIAGTFQQHIENVIHKLQQYGYPVRIDNIDLSSGFLYFD